MAEFLQELKKKGGGDLIIGVVSGGNLANGLVRYSNLTYKNKIKSLVWHDCDGDCNDTSFGDTAYIRQILAVKYINGVKHYLTSSNTWSTTPGGFLDITGTTADSGTVDINTFSELNNDIAYLSLQVARTPIANVSRWTKVTISF